MPARPGILSPAKHLFQPSVVSCLLVLSSLVMLVLIKVADSKEWTDEELRQLEKQWAEQDGEEDEETERKRLMEEKQAKKPKLDVGKMLYKSPEEIMAIVKKGEPMMMFVQVDKKYSLNEAESLSVAWHTGVINGGIAVQRFSVGENRFIFMFEDGAEGFQAKKFLTDQPECFSVEMENQKFPGRANPDYGKETNTDKKEKSEL